MFLHPDELVGNIIQIADSFIKHHLHTPHKMEVPHITKPFEATILVGYKSSYARSHLSFVRGCVF
jgi:hypothetical protein